MTLVKVFRHHLGPDLLQGVDLLPAALAANGSTGADVAAWVRRALGAARRAHREVELDDLLRQIRAGKPEMSPEARRRIAVHEAGHVIANDVLDVGALVGVSIVDQGGTTEIDAAIDGTLTAADLERHIVVAMAGRAAEQLVLANVSIGAGNGPDSDLSKATRLAQLLETQYGAGIYGPIHVGEAPFDSLARYPALLQAVQSRVEAAQTRALEILGNRFESLSRLAAELASRGFLSADQVRAVLDGPYKAPRTEAAE